MYSEKRFKKDGAKLAGWPAGSGLLHVKRPQRGRGRGSAGGGCGSSGCGWGIFEIGSIREASGLQRGGLGLAWVGLVAWTLQTCKGSRRGGKMSRIWIWALGARMHCETLLD